MKDVTFRKFLQVSDLAQDVTGDQAQLRLRTHVVKDVTFKIFLSPDAGATSHYELQL